MSVKYPNYVNLTSSSEEQPNERTPSPPPRKKSLSPPQAPSKSISSKSTHYTSSSSPSESPTPTHVAPPPKLRFVIPIKLEPQELPPPQMSPNDPYAQTMDNWPPGPSNPSPPPRVSRPPLGFPNPPPGFEPLPSTQPLFVNINNNTPLLHNNAPPLENIHHQPPNLGNQDFPILQTSWILFIQMTRLTSTSCFVNVVAPQDMKSKCSETVSTTCKKERVMSIALKAKKEFSDDETSTSESDDEEYAMAPPQNKEQKDFLKVSWSDSKNKAEDKTNEEICLMNQSSDEVTLDSSYFSDNASSLDDDSMQTEYNNLCMLENLFGARRMD
ncbi:hypothetical protein Tco_0060515 [Tanacetum coccineum]